MIDDHERFRHDLQQLLTAKVLLNDGLQQQAKIDEQYTLQIAALREKDAALDARVDSLVSAIGEFIRRLPPQ